ncbi:DNA sulfur modification protein DndD [Paenibacillus sp. AR247]|uniref:DNA sulfur modification protein DndD n=1 Tax=Paenibacillus sp. AR247 TaxID=1631599 RepID=UPI000CFA562E|nr:DNA sulfur modification protein DndD [Paenibacillus sp. AR247]PQP85507.1 DNA sulfur modification protein DndD [Paenibacillus sp. AR247]
MKFRKLTIDNYKSFLFPTEIHFPDDESGKSIFLIGGMNGAGKTSLMESINYCLYGGKVDEIYRSINRKSLALGNASVSFELVMEMDDFSELIVKRSWSAGTIDGPKAKDLTERLVVIRDGKRVSVQNKQMWQDFIRATIPPGITQFFFFDGEKIQEIASDDHSEVRLKSSLEAALGIQYINQLSSDLLYIKQEERKGFVEISSEDLDFKESELKREKSKLLRLNKERDEIKEDLNSFKEQYEEAKKRFLVTFNTEPETREAIRQNEKKRVQTSNRIGQVESEIRTLCEKYLPYSIFGSLFEDIRIQIEKERESNQVEAIKEHAVDLAKKIVRAVEEPEPIYTEALSDEKMAELEKRILILLQEGGSFGDEVKLLNLSDRDAARVLHRIEELENSDVFFIQPLLEEKRELEIEIQKIEATLQTGVASDSEKELFEQLQSEMESCSTQIGRKTEQLRIIEEDILSIEKKIHEIEIEIEKLYEKHNVSKGKADLINECDVIAGLLNQFIVRMRKNKVNLLQEKTFEMYKLLSSKSGLIKDISIDDKSYEIKITDRSGHEIKKSGLSAGEKEVFALSLLWGLAQTSQLKLPIIIDTPLSRLDSTHRDNIVRNYFPNAGQQVIILSTDTEIDNDYYRVLQSHLSGAASLVFDQKQELTTVESGYFWGALNGR